MQICISFRLEVMGVLKSKNKKLLTPVSPKLNKLQSWISARSIQRGLLYKITLISNRSEEYSSRKKLWNFFRGGLQNSRDFWKMQKNFQISFELMDYYVKKHAELNGHKRKPVSLLV